MQLWWKIKKVLSWIYEHVGEIIECNNVWTPPQREEPQDKDYTESTREYFKLGFPFFSKELDQSGHYRKVVRIIFRSFVYYPHLPLKNDEKVSISDNNLIIEGSSLEYYLDAEFMESGWTGRVVYYKYILTPLKRNESGVAH